MKKSENLSGDERGRGKEKKKGRGKWEKGKADVRRPKKDKIFRDAKSNLQNGFALTIKKTKRNQFKQNDLKNSFDKKLQKLLIDDCF